MMREEAIERYDRIRYNLLNHDDKEAVDIAFDALREQANTNQRSSNASNALNGWISVEDRLPSREGLMDDETEYVLVCERYVYGGGGNVTICGYTENGWNEWDNFGGICPERITHWMPLPEPPKEVKET